MKETTPRRAAKPASKSATKSRIPDVPLDGAEPCALPADTLPAERILLVGPTGARIEIGFSKHGLPRIVLSDEEGRPRLRAGLALFFEEGDTAAYYAEHGDPKPFEPQIELLNEHGQALLSLCVGEEDAELELRTRDGSALRL